MKWQEAWERIQSQCRRADSGCLLWTRSKMTRGYGQCWFDGEMHAAHRLSLEAKLGRRLEPGEQACHTCDTPACCEPAHLFAGTHADNMKDASAKGRTTKFKQSVMLQFLESGMSKAAVARQLGCDVRTVYRKASGPSPGPKSRRKSEAVSYQANIPGGDPGARCCEPDSHNANTNGYATLRMRDIDVRHDALRVWRPCHG
jgi:hypothetical protein